MRRIPILCVLAVLALGCGDATPPEEELTCPAAPVALCLATAHERDIAVVAASDVGRRIVLAVAAAERRLALQQQSDELAAALRDGRVSRARAILTDMHAALTDARSSAAVDEPTLSAIDLSLRPAEELVQ